MTEDYKNDPELFDPEEFQAWYGEQNNDAELWEDEEENGIPQNIRTALLIGAFALILISAVGAVFMKSGSIGSMKTNLRGSVRNAETRQEINDGYIYPGAYKEDGKTIYKVIDIQ